MLFVFADLGVSAQQPLIDLPGLVSRKVAKVPKDAKMCFESRRKLISR